MQIVKGDNLPILNFALCGLHFAQKFSQLQSAKLPQNSNFHQPGCQTR
jgi:hypothetical protein